MNTAFIDYFRCPENYARFELSGNVSVTAGYFRFGADAICYGNCTSGCPASKVTSPLYDALRDTRAGRSGCVVPFDPTDVIDGLRHERYVTGVISNRKNGHGPTLARDAYYFIRPWFPVTVRRRLQRMSLKGWDHIPFPGWPVDFTVDRILERLLAMSLKANRAERIPFIWFWPDGHSSCSIMTHDVETATGLAFCPALMDLDDAFGIKSSFQIVPEKRYTVSSSALDTMRNRGFEINLHDLNHDGRLYRDRAEFIRRAERINRHVREFDARGFRSGALYRNLDWYDAFSFSYDMSVPNVGHLDPQQGGCCTAMPYFIGKILELPLTTTQDYSLFHILDDYSMELWRRQIDLILERHGLISFIVHPDYVVSDRARSTYKMLLDYLSRLCAEENIWIALPRDVDTWWRQRSQMRLVPADGGWRIEGPGKERARIAWAKLAGEQISYAIEQRPAS